MKNHNIDLWDGIQARVNFDCKRTVCSLSPAEVRELVDAFCLLEVA